MEFSSRQRTQLELELTVLRNGHSVRTHPVKMDMSGLQALVEAPEQFIPEDDVQISLICRQKGEDLNLSLPAKVEHVRGDQVELSFVGHDLDTLEKLFATCRSITRPPLFARYPMASLVLILIGALLAWFFIAGGNHGVEETPSPPQARTDSPDTPTSEQARKPGELEVPPIPPGAVAKPKPRPAAVSVDSLSITIMDQDGQPMRTGHGLVLNQPAALIVPMTLLKGGYGGRFVIPGRGVSGLTQVLTADRVSGLALLELPAGILRGPELSAEDHGLYLGREIGVRFAGTSLQAQVAAAEQERADQSVAVRSIPITTAAQAGLGAVITAPEGNEVLGMVVSVGDGATTAQAIDIGAVRRLVRGVNSSTPMGIAAFSRRYFEDTPEGQWERVRRLVEQQQYAEALPLLEGLYDRGWSGQDTLRPYLLELYEQLARETVDQRRDTDFKAVVDRAETRLGSIPRLTELRLLRLSSLSDVEAAYGELKALRERIVAGEIDVQLVRRIVLAMAKGRYASQHYEGLVRDLDAEIALDAQFAPYHVWKGQSLFAFGEYARAAEALQTAISLDASYQTELESVVNEALSWGRTPSRSEVAYQDAGGVMIAEVRINEAAKPFRMVIDTGASLTVLTPEAAERLAISTNNARHITLNTANGSVRAPVITLDFVALGAAERRGIPAAVTDLGGGLDGLLGLSFLNGFDLTVNTNTKKLVLNRH